MLQWFMKYIQPNSGLCWNLSPCWLAVLILDWIFGATVAFESLLNHRKEKKILPQILFLTHLLTCNFLTKGQCRISHLMESG